MLFAEELVRQKVTAAGFVTRGPQPACPSGRAPARGLRGFTACCAGGAGMGGFSLRGIHPGPGKSSPSEPGAVTERPKRLSREPGCEDGAGEERVEVKGAGGSGTESPWRGARCCSGCQGAGDSVSAPGMAWAQLPRMGTASPTALHQPVFRHSRTALGTLA